MATNIITALLQGDDEPALFQEIADHLPMTLVPVQRKNDHAPDYRIEGRTGVTLGHGWSTTSPKSGISFVGILIEHPAGVHVSGVAWQSPDSEGKWFAQLQRIEAVKFDA